MSDLIALLYVGDISGVVRGSCKFMMVVSGISTVWLFVFGVPSMFHLDPRRESLAIYRLVTLFLIVFLVSFAVRCLMPTPEMIRIAVSQELSNCRPRYTLHPCDPDTIRRTERWLENADKEKP